MENSINKRMKELRLALGMTQIEFGEKLKIKQSYMTSIENEKRPVTEKMQRIICLESWNGNQVNEEWLRTGKGNMFIMPQKNDLVAKAAVLLGQQDPVFEAFVETYSKLDPANREVLLNWGLDFLKSLQQHSEDS